MKIITSLILLISTLSFAQSNCQYEFEEKTDSTYVKSLSEKIIYEKVFGSSRKFIYFKLMQTDGIPILNIQYIEKKYRIYYSQVFRLKF